MLNEHSQIYAIGKDYSADGATCIQQAKKAHPGRIGGIMVDQSAIREQARNVITTSNRDIR